MYCSKIKSVKALLYQSLTEFRVDEAKTVIEFLRILKPQASEYVRIEKAVADHIAMLRSDTAYLQGSSYGTVDENLFNEIKNMPTHLFEGATTQDIRRVLWAQTLREPFDKFSYMTIANILARNKQDGHLQVDFVASLIYLMNTEQTIIH